MTEHFKVGSLFDGSGGFPLAALLCGGFPAWASEVEPYPIAVTHSRFPSMKHLGDVAKINGSEVEPVDVITFGSPCQDMSVAGKREGIKHSAQGDKKTTRSGLFYEAVRIIREMRKATNGRYPRYAVWENVPGAFSSNKGRDFHAVLEALCSICDNTVSIPEPTDRRKPAKLVWLKAGEVVGDSYSVCWRTLDAQYWGVPQRRKRVYLVADFNTQCAGKVLFKPESLRGNMPQGDEKGKGIALDVVGSSNGSAGTERLVSAGFDGQMGAKAENIGYKNEIAPTLNAEKVMQLVAQPIVFKERAGCEGGGKGALWSDKAFTLATNQDMSVVCTAKQQDGQPVIALQGNGIDRADTAGCNGCGWRENEMYTLNTVDRPAVCFPLNEQVILRHKAMGKGTGFGAGDDGDPSYTLQANHPHAVCFDRATFNQGINAQYDFEVSEEGILSTVVARGPSGVCYKNQKQVDPPRRYIIRRIMPVECARLQGFHDWWGELAPYDPVDAEFWEGVRKTYAEINGKKYRPTKDLKKWYNKLHTDSAEYKIWGNGIALPCAVFVFQGIAEILGQEKQA